MKKIIAFLKKGQEVVTQKKGFTLIELLVVVTIIGVLATMAISIYNWGIEKSKLKVGESGVSNIASALDLYKMDNGVYPTVYAADGTTAIVTGAAIGYVRLNDLQKYLQSGVSANTAGLITVNNDPVAYYKDINDKTFAVRNVTQTAATKATVFTRGSQGPTVSDLIFKNAAAGGDVQSNGKEITIDWTVVTSLATVQALATGQASSGVIPAYIVSAENSGGITTVYLNKSQALVASTDIVVGWVGSATTVAPTVAATSFSLGTTLVPVGTTVTWAANLSTAVSVTVNNK